MGNFLKTIGILIMFLSGSCALLFLSPLLKDAFGGQFNFEVFFGTFKMLCVFSGVPFFIGFVIYSIGADKPKGGS